MLLTRGRKINMKLRILEYFKENKRKKTDPLYSMKFGNNYNIEEFLHGYCDLFLVYFLKNMQGWAGKIMVRTSNKMIIHAYAERINNDGIKEYADARGIFCDKKDFFKPYWFRKKDMELHDITEEETKACFKRIEEECLESAILELFEYVYREEKRKDSSVTNI